MAGPSKARAGDVTTIPCGLADEGTIHIDGLLSDWEGVSPIILRSARPRHDRTHAGGARQLQLRQQNLYL